MYPHSWVCYFVSVETSLEISFILISQTIQFGQSRWYELYFGQSDIFFRCHSVETTRNQSHFGFLDCFEFISGSFNGMNFISGKVTFFLLRLPKMSYISVLNFISGEVKSSLKKQYRYLQDSHKSLQSVLEYFHFKLFIIKRIHLLNRPKKWYK